MKMVQSEYSYLGFIQIMKIFTAALFTYQKKKNNQSALLSTEPMSVTFSDQNYF